MKTVESKYEELDAFLSEEISPEKLASDLNALREQCISIFMRSLIYEEKSADDLSVNVVDQLYHLKRLIDILSRITPC